jgi:hypothetical protein
MGRRSLALAIVVATLGVLAVAACSSGGGDYGPASDVQALRTMWQAQSTTGKIAQVVVVGNYGVVDLTGTEGNPNYVELFVKGASQASGPWQPDIGQTYSSNIYGPVSTCAFTQRGVPQDVAAQLVANDTRLAAAARQNPQAGCGG